MKIILVNTIKNQTPERMGYRERESGEMCSNISERMGYREKELRGRCSNHDESSERMGYREKGSGDVQMFK